MTKTALLIPGNNEQIMTGFGAMALGNKAVNTIIVYGDEESELLKERCQSVALLTPGVVEIEVPGARHQIDNATYARTLAAYTAESFAS
ncbi:MAG TPA: hypothetical protein VLA92_02740 [Candidatus Saccharimonadales bacterium]|nr:hypothetical protein [Candidatus Saccharimonadales bacterium]